MLDPRLLRNNIDSVVENLSRKQFILDAHIFKEYEKNRKFLQISMESLQSQRNNISKEIAQAKLYKKNFDILHSQINDINKKLYNIKYKFNSLQKEIKNFILSLPNILDDQVPYGHDKKDNVEISYWGVLRKYNFTIRNHVELGKLGGGLNFSDAAEISGSNFVVMTGQIAYLHRALIQFMLDIHIDHHGYKEYYVPYLVNQNSLYGSGQLPKFFNELFRTQSLQHSADYYALIPTAEVPLINLLKHRIINEDRLPIKMVAHSPCFRVETGNYGTENRGLIRMHQFDKVEMIQIVIPEHSIKALEDITGHAEKILRLLNLPYRKILLCSGDTGFTACKTYDLEVWLPSVKKYLEISSCSSTSDFQSRRMQIRYRNKKDNNIRLLHILNGSGLAVGRTLVAILENYQLEDGCIEVPYALRSYMNGLTCIR